MSSTLPPGMPERGSFADRFGEIERRLSALERAKAGSISSDGTDAFLKSGDLNLSADGAIRIGADLVVLDADGLAVEGGQVVAVHADVAEQLGTGNQSLSSTLIEYATFDFTVPSWVETARVLCWAYGQATMGGSGHLLIVSARVNDQDDGASTTSVPANSTGIGFHMDERTIASPGSTIKCSAYMGISAGSNSANQGSVWGLLIGHAT